MAERFDLTGYAYAHRGLWQPDGAPENSLAAFRAAAAAGLGAELDLRPSADGAAMVFHDPALERLTGQAGLFEQASADDLSGLRLGGTSEPVPSLEALLGLWPADLPLLAEIKIDGSTDPIAFARLVAGQMTAWAGPAAVMSFSEAAVRALPSGLMRGQLVTPSVYSGPEAFAGVVRRAVDDGIDYLGVHHSDAALLEQVTGETAPGLAVWTVRTEDELATARGLGGAVIFETLDPDVAKPPAKP